MKTYHILNGDCLAEQLIQTKINKDFIVCRECLIEGDVYATNFNDLWEIRSKYISDTYNISTEEYYFNTVNEFEKLKNLPNNSEVCLWFENDLFCQVNMWFVLSILASNSTLKIFRVFPLVENNAELWKGFGNCSSDKIEKSFSLKIEFTNQDIDLGNFLWKAYQNKNLNDLSELSKTKSNCFKCLDEVCQAHIDRYPVDKTLGRPDKLVKEIIENKSKEFETVFSEFSKREGIYGFGDMQLKVIYNRQMKH